MTRAFRGWTAKSGYCAHRIGEDELRPSRSRRPASPASSRPCWRSSTGASRRACTSRRPTRRSTSTTQPVLREHGAQRSPRLRGRSAARRRQLARHRRHQRARGARGSRPPPPCRARAGPRQLLLVSARSETALGARGQSLARAPARDRRAAARRRRLHAQHRPPPVPAPPRGRRARRPETRPRASSGRDASRAPAAHRARPRRRSSFLFPGQGAQYAQMARDLYRAEPRFRARVDELCDALAGRDSAGTFARRCIRARRRSRRDRTAAADRGDAAGALRRRARAGRAVAVAGASRRRRCSATASASTWRRRSPASSRWRDALGTGRRARRADAGAAAGRDARRAAWRRPTWRRSSTPTLSRRRRQHAAVDGRRRSGSGDCARRGERRPRRHGVARRVAHEPRVPLGDDGSRSSTRFAALVASACRARRRRSRWVSNVTGTWITAAQATDPAYWAQHLRQPVRFADGVATLLADGDAVILEVGPGRRSAAS